MKRNKFILTVIALLGAFGLALAAKPSTANLSEPAKEAIIEALTGPAGEYAAYAMYNAVIDKYGEVEPYVSIREAEARHIEALKRVLDRYGVAYPKENPYIGKVQAPESLEEAAKAWAEGEVENVAMYDRLIGAVSDYPDVVRVFENLRRASQEKHLPAFLAAAENGGTLTKAQMQQLGMSHGHGGQGQGRGKCQGQGQGKGQGQRRGRQ